MNKFTFIALSLLLVPLHFFAQTNYKRASVVLINRQHLEGYIDYKEWNINPVSFSFKDKDGQRTLSTKEVASFTIDTFETFERNIFKAKSSGKVRNINDIRMRQAYTAHTDTVFLRLLTKGAMLNLYVYEDMTSVRYFVKINQSGAMQELNFDEYLNEDDQRKIESSYLFRGQLIFFANDEKAKNKTKVLRQIPNLSYSEKELVTIINLLNGADIKKRVPSYYVARPFAGVFIQRSSLSYSGNFPLAEDASINSSYRPGINIGLDFYHNYNIRKYKVRIELSLSSAAFTADKLVVSGATGTRGYTHSFDQYNIAFAPQFMMNVYNAKSLKVNAGIGLSTGYSIYSNNEYIRTVSQYGIDRAFDDNFDFSKFSVALPIRAGVSLHKFEMYAKYNLPLTNNTSYINYSATIQSFQLGVNYLF